MSAGEWERLGPDDLEAMVETLNIIEDSETMAAIAEAENETP